MKVKELLREIKDFSKVWNCFESIFMWGYGRNSGYDEEEFFNILKKIKNSKEPKNICPMIFSNEQSSHLPIIAFGKKSLDSFTCMDIEDIASAEIIVDDLDRSYSYVQQMACIMFSVTWNNGLKVFVKGDE